jgi:hypothetical protein
VPSGGLALSRYEYQMSGWATGGAYSRPGSTVGPPSRTQRELFCGPRAGLSHSCLRGGESSGLLVLKFHRWYGSSGETHSGQP